MHRNDLLDKLAAYKIRFPEEVKTADELIQFVQAHPDCFERTLKVGHVTGSAWVVNKAQTHVLLTHHKKLDMWVQLGGHADGNPDILDAAFQEAVEESGLSGLKPLSPAVFDIDIHQIPERKDEPAHNHYDIRFAFRCTDTEGYIVSEESHDLAWIEIRKLHELTREISMLRMGEKWIALIGKTS